MLAQMTVCNRLLHFSGEADILVDVCFHLPGLQMLRYFILVVQYSYAFGSTTMTDRDRMTLYDRLSRSVIVVLPKA